MSQFAALTRLKEPENSSLYSKMLVYDGENLKDTDPRAKSFQEYRDYAGVDEGMSGISTRFAFKILTEGLQLRQRRGRGQPRAPDVRARAADRARAVPGRDRAEVPRPSSRSILASAMPSSSARRSRPAYLESYSEYGQNIFDRYVTYADYWIQDHEYRDTDTGEVFDRASLNAELEKIEKPAGIANPKDFRNEIVNFVLRARANNAGQEPAVDQLREAAHGDREEDVLEHRRAAAGDQLQRQGQRRRAEEARGLRHPHGRQGLHRRSRCACCASGICGCARVPNEDGPSFDRSARSFDDIVAILQQIIDRRLSGKNKSIGNRERFLRRYKGQIREAVRARGRAAATSATLEQGENVTHARARHVRAGVRPRPAAATARTCIRATRST